MKSELSSRGVVALNEFCAEFMGTFMILFFGNGSGAASQIVGVAGLSQWEVSFIWGLGVLAGILVSAPVSGAHLNPAVTFGMAAGGNLPLWKMPHYLLAQLLGGIGGAGIIYSFFWPTIAEFEAANDIIRGEAGSFLSSAIFRCTLNPKITALHGFYIEWFITAILLLIICYVNDKDATDVGGYGPFFPPVMVGFAVAILVACFGPITAACLNPARDLGPRIVTLIAGWKGSAFPGEKENPWWPFIFGPILGGMTGVLFWQFIACRTFRYAAAEKQRLEAQAECGLCSLEDSETEKVV